jgi:NAD-dependent dihydropyrimidine dehydrogenase PreA subunit
MGDETASRIQEDPNGHVRRVVIEWGPTVDAELCSGCGACIDFCHHDVYLWTVDKSKVAVAHKLHCVPGCSHCGTLCEAGAISFPTLEEIKRARQGARSRTA